MNAHHRKQAKRKLLLGMSYGTARARLERTIMFSMAVKLGLDDCFRCQKKIKSVLEFSVEHKESWQLSDIPLEKYFDLENIAFSHALCNSNAAYRRQTIHGTAKGAHCKCAPCLASRKKYNADWMKNWRASGKDKSRNNYQGAAQECK
jgi:hypothetical protein